MKQGNFITRIISVIFAIFVVAYMGYQIWMSLYNPVRTVSAVYAEAEDSVKIDGLVVRDETVLNSVGSGALEMVIGEGERAAKGDSIAVVYQNQDALDNTRKISELDSQIARLETLYQQGNEVYDLNSADAAIAETNRQVIQMTEREIFSGISDVIENLKLKTLSREYIYRDKKELKSVIDELRVQEKKYASAKGAVKKCITAPFAGYFSHELDGYEQVLNSGRLGQMTPREFQKLSSMHAVSETGSGIVGKMIGNYVWYFAALTDSKNAERFKNDDKITLKFSNRLYPEVSAVVDRVSDAENGKVLVVFSSNEHISEFTLPREVTAEAVIKTYSGLKVPREALRVDEKGNKGVYCLIDSQVRFKKVNIIFEKDSYYITAYDSADTDSLLLYDEIIVSSKDLTDRKVIK